MRKFIFVSSYILVFFVYVIITMHVQLGGIPTFLLLTGLGSIPIGLRNLYDKRQEKKLLSDKKTVDSSKDYLKAKSSTKYLMTAANGMQVWVPADKLDQWQKAQADQSDEAKRAREALVAAMLRKMEQLKADTSQKSAAPASKAFCQINAEDNITFIAENIACIYFCVSHHEAFSNLSEAKTLYATAIIDSATYLSRGEISVDELKSAVHLGKRGEIALAPFRNIQLRKRPDAPIFPYKNYKKTHRNHHDEEENGDLIGMIMQLEALFFSIDTNVSVSEIIDVIISEKKSIASIVNRTLSNIHSCPRYRDYLHIVDGYAEESDFFDTLNNFNN